MSQLPFLPYAGKSGHVAEVATSTARAISEDLEGVTAERQRAVLEFVEMQGSFGVTWRDVADHLGLHHGQASGVLSTLHKAGHIFIHTPTKRNRCVVYVGSSFKPFIRADERQDEPKQTRGTQELNALNGLLDAVERMLFSQTMTTVQEVRTAFNEYKEVTQWHSI